MADRKIRRALISVYDKTGIVDFARALHEEFGIEIISTGGTAKLLKDNDIPVTLVEQVTGFPEMMDGRVKTLHPRIHAAILADRDNPEHMKQLADQGIEPIDMVVVNLYPFEETIAKPDCTFEEAIEMIDIGGPCLLRAAAKNHRHVTPVIGSRSFPRLLDAFRLAGAPVLPETYRMHAARAAYHITSRYDDHVRAYLRQHERRIFDEATGDTSSGFALAPAVMDEQEPLRYGENPHQQAQRWTRVGHYSEAPAARQPSLAGPATEGMSHNNFLDASAALELCAELSRALRVRCVGPAFQPAQEVCGTGFQPVKEEQCGTGFQPVPKGGNLRRIDDEKHTRRNLPHIQTPGKVYFVTFRLKEEGELSPEERTVVFDACHYWDGKKLDLHAVVVMPDHVHLLLTPREVAHDQWVSLGEIVHSIKRHSAREINRMRGRHGPLWLDDFFDRIMRNEREFCETADYIANNPLTAGLTEEMDYRWWWDEEHHKHRLQTGATSEDPSIPHRLETGATPGDTPAAPAVHRLETGATQAPQAPDTCVFIKHTNACGVGIASDPFEAYQRAYLGDPNAAMGGILACDFEITAEFAEAVMDTYTRYGKEAGAGGFFVEVWVAPSFQNEVMKLIRTRKKWGERVRLLEVGEMDAPPDPEERDFKRIAGGMLVQNRDLVGLNEDQWKVVTERQPTEQEMADLRLAWLICKHTKSNAITICADGMLIGNGAGQMSRVMSCRIATWLAAENGHQDRLARSVAASDAFFPFRDGPDILMDAGVKAIIQPGGSKRDQDTIDACNERGVAMVYTGTRHFKH
jgi:AICAR transformylase/IMP cyclohydrolase PurH/REP element-mobilizing transposase RayT